MNGEKTDGVGTVDDKSPAQGKAGVELTPFQKRFNDALEGWKKDGCSVVLDEKTPTERFCGGKPHRVKMEEPGEDGQVTMVVDCQAGHERQWEFKVPQDEMKAELARQQEAMKKAVEDAGKTKDPLKASVTITLDLRTQDVSIEPWVPTPGVGLQLAAMLTAHFSHELMSSKLMKRDTIVTPPKGILNPKTGKPFVS